MLLQPPHPLRTVVVEGPDGGGKTTLVNKLCTAGQQLGMSVYHAHAGYRFKRQGIFVYHTAILDMAIRSGRNLIVIDRHWPSEIVYGHVCRGGTPWPHLGRMMDRVLQRLNTTYVFCLPPTKVCVDTALARAKDELYPTRVGELCQAYQRLLAGELGYAPPKHNVLRHDRTKDSASALIAKILTNDLVQRQPFDGLITGNLDATSCLLGDALNPKTRHAQWPFHEHANSSLTLANALDFAMHDESQTFVCNSNDVELAAQLLQKNARVSGRRPIMVALGARAYDAAVQTRVGRRLHVDLKRVDHPQYVRRFCATDVAEYGAQLRQALA
jgi:thymidylate kinase